MISSSISSMPRNACKKDIFKTGGSKGVPALDKAETALLPLVLGRDGLATPYRAFIAPTGRRRKTSYGRI